MKDLNDGAYRSEFYIAHISEYSQSGFRCRSQVQLRLQAPLVPTMSFC